MEPKTPPKEVASRSTGEGSGGGGTGAGAGAGAGAGGAGGHQPGEKPPTLSVQLTEIEALADSGFQYIDTDGARKAFTCKFLDEDDVEVSVDDVAKLTKNRIVLLNTGGTISMVKTEEGLANCGLHYLAERLPLYPDFYEWDFANRAVVITIDKPLDSSAMTPVDWVKMATVIWEVKLAQVESGLVDAHQGFVVSHGTDTLAYTASALSYAFGNIDMTVVLTAAQLPLAYGASDGVVNLYGACEVAFRGFNAFSSSAEASVIPNPTVYFNRQLFPANNLLKFSSSSFSAFASFSSLPVAYSDVGGMSFNPAVPRGAVPGADITRKVREVFDTRIRVIRITPFLSSVDLNLLRDDATVVGVLLEGYGAGNGPTGDSHFATALEELARRKPVVYVTQCVSGATAAGAYAVGLAAVSEDHIIPLHDWTSERASVFLSRTLGRLRYLEYDPDSYWEGIRHLVNVQIPANPFNPRHV